MTIEEASYGLAKLKAAYPSAKALDDISGELYTETLTRLHKADWESAFTDLVHGLKWFPSISEIVDAVDYCKGRRLQWQEHEDREKRLARAETALLNPAHPTHKNVVGPAHARFIRLLKGEEKFPEPEWMKRKKGTSVKVVTENGYVPITDAERARRTAILRQQAQTLMAESK